MNKKTKIIGICGSSLYDQQPLQFIQELQKESSNNNFHIIALCCSADSRTTADGLTGDEQLLELIRHIPFKGIVLFADTMKNKDLLYLLLSICQERHIPVFSIDGPYLNGCYNMRMDNSASFEGLVRHVIEIHNCRIVNMIAGKKEDSFSEERIAAYKKVLAEQNIPFEEDRLGYGDYWDIPAREVVRSFLSSSLPMPQAIVCANDSMAIAACSELFAAGYEVPKDIIVTGFDGIQSGQYHVPVLTTCRPDFQDAACFIVKELQHIELVKEFHPRDYAIAYIPMIRQSCGCDPASFHHMNHIVTTLYNNNCDSSWHNFAMNEMITANLHHESITELASILPRHVGLWIDHFRFIAVKEALLSSYEVPDHITDMVSLLFTQHHRFLETGKLFSLEDILPCLGNVLENEVIVIHILKSGSTVYGYNVEGFNDIDERKMQRCNDFSFFLSYCLDSILHNARQRELTHGIVQSQP